MLVKMPEVGLDANFDRTANTANATEVARGVGTSEVDGRHSIETWLRTPNFQKHS